MRDAMIERLVNALQSHGFRVSVFTEFNSCFDIAAKKDATALILKAFSNVDAMRPESAAELRKAAALFHATPLLVGEKTKAGPLVSDTRYERFGISVLSPETFGAFLDGSDPAYRSFKGKQTVGLDADRMTKLRKQRDLSRAELAKHIGVSAQTIHRYEGGAPADAADAQKIEELLRHPLIVPLPLPTGARSAKGLFQDDFSDSALEKLHELGLQVALFEHAPFKAFANPAENLLVNVGKEKRDIQRKALVLEKTKTVFKAHSIVISKEYRLANVGHTPVIAEEELESFSRPTELLHEIQKREKQKK
jgi:putative transcriptional regulator